MTKHERIMRQARFEDVDRIPLLGGWMNSAEHLQELGGTTEDEFWSDGWAGGLRAYQALDVDGMLGHIVPASQTSVRQGRILDDEHAHRTTEDVLAFIEATLSDDQIIDAFDADDYYDKERASMEATQARYGDILHLPARWNCMPSFGWYGTFGYRAFFETVALYPDAWERVFRASGVAARLRNECLARVYNDMGHPPLIMCGDDICDNRGPMVSPQFLEDNYWQGAKHALEPLCDAGIKPICHCDGNVMPLMEQILDVGFAGMQGFQEECGVHVSDLAKLRTRDGEPLVFFCGLVVTQTLPWGSVDDVRADIEYAIDATDGGRGLFLFPANVINPEVPIDNVRAAYSHAKEYSTDYDTPANQRRTEWPWPLRDA
ncbi:hypothetical protein HOK31_14945 [Candidatus Poribacteria bacterium]|nr:hypothetical protein [Candidatus Poribacteria bacterium]